jgi:hypothetical protein
MNKSCVLVLALVGHTLFAQGNWSPPITLCPKKSAPDFEIDSRTGDLHIIAAGSWDFGTSGANYTKTDSLGNILIQEEIPGAEGDIGGWTNGPSIDVDSDGFPHVVFRQMVERGIFNTTYANRRLGEWRQYRQIGSQVSGGAVVRIAMDGQNRAHVGQGSVAAYSGQVLYRRLINGAIDLMRDGIQPYRPDDRFEIDATPDGKVYLVTGRPNGYRDPVTLFRSDDGGREWSEGIDLHSDQCQQKNGVPDLFVDASGNVHVCYGTQSDASVGGKPSIRYVRLDGGMKVRDLAATRAGDLKDYVEGSGWSVGSVAASDDGKTVGIAFMDAADGDCYFIWSTDEGATWSDREFIAGPIRTVDGRNKPVLKTHRNHFYVVYPLLAEVQMRMFRNAGDFQPVAEAGPARTGVEGSPVTFDGSATVDTGRNAGITTYAWDFENDGTWDIATGLPAVQHIYPDEFTGIAKLRVTDRVGHTSEDTVSVRVGNAPPVADAGGPYQGRVGVPVELTGTAVDPGTQDALSFDWDLNNDGSFETTGSAATRTFFSTGRYIVRFRATDDSGAAGTDTASVVVIDLPPEWIRPFESLTLLEDSALTLPIDSLWARVSDAEDAVEDLVFGIHRNRRIQWSFDTTRQVFILRPDPGWHGRERIAFSVTDRSGQSAMDTCDAVVLSRTLFPSAFFIVEPRALLSAGWPDTILFRWHAPQNADSAVAYYEWMLTQAGNTANPIRQAAVFDTVFAFVPDRSLAVGDFYWTVSAFGGDGVFRRSEDAGVLTIDVESFVADRDRAASPDNCRLYPNYPNPFNGGTQISFALPKTADVRLAVFNPLGQEVAVLREGELGPGIHSVRWDGTDSRGLTCPSGVYVCRLFAGSRTFLIKMLLMQ